MERDLFTPGPDLFTLETYTEDDLKKVFIEEAPEPEPPRPLPAPSYMKQTTFIEHEAKETRYTTATGSPIYVPKDRRPHVLELRHNPRAAMLLQAIERSGVTPDEKQFLADAVHRHMIFNYELIADYYAHATPEMQRLMEASALVIIDVDQAIELGYVRLCSTLRNLYLEEVANA